MPLMYAEVYIPTKSKVSPREIQDAVNLLFERGPWAFDAPLFVGVKELEEPDIERISA